LRISANELAFSSSFSYIWWSFLSVGIFLFVFIPFNLLRRCQNGFELSGFLPCFSKKDCHSLSFNESIWQSEVAAQSYHSSIFLMNKYYLY
jgi:hypothetical protein